MERIINYSCLNKVELQYEVSIRRQVPADTVCDLKRQMSELSHILPTDIQVSSFSIALDLEQSSTTLSYVEDKIATYEQTEDRNILTRLMNFVNHLHFRLNRLTPVSQFVESCSHLKSRLYLIEKKIESFFQSGHIELEAEGVEPSDANNTMPLIPPRTVTPTRIPSPVQNRSSSPNFIPTRTRDNLTDYCVPTLGPCSSNFVKELKSFSFDGKSCPRSFLQRLEEFSYSRSISEDLLCKHAFEIFTGQALHWFRFQHLRNSKLSWKDIRALLIKDFGLHDYDYKLMEAIRKRTQGSSESIIVYVSIMFGMFSRLKRALSEEEQLEILLHNIRPCYSMFVTFKNATTVDELVSTCQAYEQTQERCSNFREPQQEISPFYSEFGYRASKNSPCTSRDAMKVTSISQTQPKSQSQSSNSDYCFRCRTKGHSLKTCTQPRFLICFKCGKHGVKISDCPTCSPSSSSNEKN